MSVLKPSIDFKKEYNSNQTYEYKIKKVLYLAKEKMPDLALLEINNSNSRSQTLPNPIDLDVDIQNKCNCDVAVIGYPAYDPRGNSLPDMNRIFNRIYGVKRLQPGKVTNIISDTCFNHDCSTLGGNSGSPVIDICTGKALGIHYAGKYMETNYAVPSSYIDGIIRKL